MLFGLLEDENRPGLPSFPCVSMPRNFAFTCSRFAKLYRERHVRELRFCSMLRPAQDELAYFEAVNGAFGRFSAVESVAVVGSDCVSRALMAETDEFDSGYWSEPAPPKSAGRFSESADGVRLAVDARKLLAAAASNCLENSQRSCSSVFLQKRRIACRGEVCHLVTTY